MEQFLEHAQQVITVYLEQHPEFPLIYLLKEVQDAPREHTAQQEAQSSQSALLELLVQQLEPQHPQIANSAQLVSFVINLDSQPSRETVPHNFSAKQVRLVNLVSHALQGISVLLEALLLLIAQLSLLKATNLIKDLISVLHARTDSHAQTKQRLYAIFQLIMLRINIAPMLRKLIARLESLSIFQVQV